MTLAIVGLSCDDGRPREEPSSALTVAAAGSLRFALDEAAGVFRERRPDVEVTVVYGASGSLFAQISQGAPFDVFLSADADYPRRLAEDGLAGKEFEYAVGGLAVWARRESGLGIAERGVEALRDERIRRVAIANPKVAPYGAASAAALRNLRLYDDVRGKLVFGDNVAQAAQFVESGAAEVGMIPLSLTAAKPMRESGESWTVPEDAHPPLIHGGGIMSRSQKNPAARAFRDFLLSDEGQEILRRHGFGPAP